MTQFDVKKAPILNVTPWISGLALSACGAALLFSGCSGASSHAGSAGSADGPFVLSQISVSNGAVWQINRPVQLTFSLPVDFDTVNLNTISIQRINGQPAVGEFTLDPADARTVIFQPVCPTLEDFGDAGFKPGGVIYQIDVPTTSSGATTVRSTNGKGVTTGLTLTFSTPTSTILGEVFLDPLPGPARPVVSPGTGTMLRTGNLAGGVTPVDTFFEIQPDGTGALPGSFLVQNNFYSDPGSQVSMHVRFDQPVSPRQENISSDRLYLQYFDANNIWQDLITEVLLEANCEGTGASVRITPVGILPQGRQMRLVVTPEFEDLVGDRNSSPLDKFGLMIADATLDGGSPVENADELLESFLDTSYEDFSAALSAPSAAWGPDGLEAAFAFDGTGGPGGNFDLHIAPNSTVVFDTTSTLFFGGENGVPQNSQLAVNGRLDVRDLYIPASSTLRIQGPNAAMILASRDVLIEGRLSCDGGSAASVFTLNTPNQPESGGVGVAGGGDGGIGSFLTTQVTPRGGNGEGAFGAPNMGGEGGEAGWSTDSSSNGINRRPGGGGGGRFGHDEQTLWTGTNSPPGGALCDRQEIYGLDAESGFPGSDNATSSQGNHHPYGGHAGPGPFGLFPGTDDDFFGTKIKDFGTLSQQLIVGELSSAMGGSGGGAGGDATLIGANESYPPPNLIYVNQDKGAGGAGGAGAMTILALGNITVTATGKISAIGGHGSGGENTSGVNRIGGGSGGGSGGHLVLQSAGSIDLSSVPVGFMGIDARGGEGGAGAGDNGGASAHELNAINKDAKHPGISVATSDNPWEVIDVSCVDYANSLSTGQTWLIRITGGDGGPGLIQMHVGDLGTDVVYPTGAQNSLRQVVQPVPHGYDFDGGQWRDHLLPIFGRFSMSQSTWIPLGEAAVDPVSATLDELSFLFEGTDPVTGEVLDADADEVVDPLPAILTQSLVLDTGDPTDRTVILDPAGLAAGDQIYSRNPNLLRNFNLTVGGIPYSVGGAVLDSGDGMLHVTVADPNADLSTATGNVELRPRYFAITTQGIENFLPTNASVAFHLELAEANPNDSSAPSAVNTTGFVSDISDVDLDALYGVDPSLVRFLRYRVTFDITGGIEELNATTPRPKVDFLRVPFKF
jgi:hypothetical protein